MPDELQIGLAPTRSLRILYTGDLHGNLEKMKYLSTVIQQERAKQEICLLLDSGDWSKGGALSDHFKGKPMAEIMEYLKYDAVGLGEGELSWGVRVLKNLASMVSFPLLCANLAGEVPEEIKAFTLKKCGDIQLGIIGISSPIKLPERYLTMSSPEESLKHALEAPEIKNADMVILLSHLGIEKDREIAGLFPAIDVIIGGHSHVHLEEPERINGTLLVHGGAFGEFLGSLTLDVGATITIRPK